MKPGRSAEPAKPAAASLALIDETVDLMKADVSEMSEWFEWYATGHRKRLSFDIDLVRRFASAGKRILELGSVPLLVTGALRRAKYDIEGVDIDPGRFQRAIHRLDLVVHRCNIETEPLPLEDSSFDLAIFNELFEHLRINPIFTMSEVHRILKPGGLMLLSTPNLRSLRGLFNFLARNRSFSITGSVYDEYSKLESLGHMGHVREYTTVEVCEFLSRIGFEVTEIVYRGTYTSRPARLITILMPQLRPFFSVVAAKRARPPAPS